MKNLSKFGLAAALSFAALAAALAQGPNNGTYHLRSAIGRYLDVQWGNANAGTPMHLWDFNGGVAQKWIIKKTPQGFYTIQSDLGRYLESEFIQPLRLKQWGEID